jgi:hypothetical protein
VPEAREFHGSEPIEEASDDEAVHVHNLAKLDDIVVNVPTL